MHKLTKGLKKKKKGKKSKHKEEELFKPEELEAYRREHQSTAEVAEETTEATAPADNEEWKKFNALTAGIDTILKKTQGDLDRIKSTSFFQRVPPPSEVKKRKEEEERQLTAEREQSELQEVQKTLSVTEAAIVRVSESESDYEDEDDIFDTTYIDVIASGEVKLAYIPESPDKEPEGDDPFDTSIAERAILGPSVGKKGKKLVPIGSAVEILTGRVQAPTCVPIKRPITRRQIQKEKDLLLESFDANANNIEQVQASSPIAIKHTLLDDDAPAELLNTPIDLSQSLHLVSAATTPIAKEEQISSNLNILDEFDIVGKHETEDFEDDEFALLAAESLSKQSVTGAPVLTATKVVDALDKQQSWSAFDEVKSKAHATGEEEFGVDGDDPFDTTFAENILPGKAELKIIENEILNIIESDFKEPKSNIVSDINKKVSIQIIDPAGQKEAIVTADRVSEHELHLIQPCHRDLLGGSSTDLSKLGDQPLQPKETKNQDYIEYCDPFDTSIVEIVKLPGQTELKFLERELLGEIKRSLSDENFDPRADEPVEKQQSRKVSFDLPLDQHRILLDASKVSKPLTPYYIRENSIPEVEENIDPFDTSFVAEVAPGKAELKLIESELFEKNDILLDSDFDPRDDKQVAVAKVVQTIERIVNPVTKSDTFKSQETVDLLAVEHNVEAKVLTPAAERTEIVYYIDPFDTTIASNILPGKTELKLLETELIHTELPFKPTVSGLSTVLQTKVVNKNLFEEQEGEDFTNVNVKPLTPLLEHKREFEQEIDDDIDPFDTSIASNIGLGKTELKLLESELI